MKTWNMIAALTSLVLLTACDNDVESATQIVTWEVSDGKTVAVIEKRRGMQIAYIADPSLQSDNNPQPPGDPIGIGRILVAGNVSDNEPPIKLNQFPFVYQYPGSTPVHYACPNCSPCSSGDDCVPPVPPLLLDRVFPAAEQFSCPDDSPQFKHEQVCKDNCGVSCAFMPIGR